MATAPKSGCPLGAVAHCHQLANCLFPSVWFSLDLSLRMDTPEQLQQGHLGQREGVTPGSTEVFQ
jgi:hypothetical protein